LLSKWPIRNKLLAGLVLLLVIVATLSWSGFHGLYAYRELVKSLGRRAKELPLAAEFSLLVSDLRLSLNQSRPPSWPAAPDGETPAYMQLARSEFRTNLTLVQDALDRYHDQLKAGVDAGTRIGDGRRELASVERIQQALNRVRESDRDEDWIFNNTVRFGQLEKELEQLQAEGANLPRFLVEDIGQVNDEVRGQYRTLIRLYWATSIAAALMLFLFIRMSYQWMFRPLRVLIKGSRKVAAGSFDHRIHLDTQDEMAELAAAMNGMTERFRQIRDDLDRKVQERTKQVVRSERLASVGFLAAGVAHEINNPLASIAMCAESLHRRIGDVAAVDDAKGSVFAEYLQMIQSEAFRCKEITDKLLDYSRHGEAQRQEADLRELVQGVIDMVGHLGRYQEKNVVMLQGGPLVASINVQEIKQVVLNLITNGLDSLEPGGTVEIELSCHADTAEIVFSDDGCGMTAEVLEHLFEPFFTRRRGGQGTGLGLSITHRIVDDHGGHIDAYSDGPGRGSQFRVTLPVAASQKEREDQYQAA